MLSVGMFVGTESAMEGYGAVTVSFDLEEVHAASLESREITTPVSFVLCSSDARALGKALLESADVAERLGEEMRTPR